MKSIDLEKAITVLKLTETSTSNQTLQEQVAPYFDRSPYIVLDLGNVMLTSMLIGEIINLEEEFRHRWEDSSIKMALANVSDFNHKVLQQVQMHKVLSIHDTISQAIDGM